MSISVRPMELKDRQTVAELFYDAFWPKIIPLHHMSKLAAIGFIRDTLYHNAESLDGTYVADLEGQIVGAIKLVTAFHQDHIGHLSLSRIMDIGILRLLKSGLLFAMMSTKVRKHELYIDMVAVRDDMRGLGVGSQLMNFAESFAKKKPGITDLTLGVIEKNIGALRLYERLGFLVYNIRRSSLISKLSGVNRMYEMRKVIC